MRELQLNEMEIVSGGTVVIEAVIAMAALSVCAIAVAYYLSPEEQADPGVPVDAPDWYKQASQQKMGTIAAPPPA